MLWIITALGSYFFSAVSALLDKYLLSDRIKEPAVYAFFMALFSLFALVFIPFGAAYFGPVITGVYLLSGALFLLSLLAFYQAVKENPVSRVTPLVGVTVSVVALFAEGVRSGLDLSQVFAIMLLVGGGILIAFDLPIRRDEQISVQVLVSGMLLAASLMLLKYGFSEGNFVSGLVWSRIGMFLTGIGLLLVPTWRKHIHRACHKTGTLSSRNMGTGVLFVLNKISGGVAAFLLSYALSLGPIVFVQALSGAQYLFLFFLAWILSVQYQDIFEERFGFWDWAQKGVAVLMIVIGIYLAGTSGTVLVM